MASLVIREVIMTGAIVRIVMAMWIVNIIVVNRGHLVGLGTPLGFLIQETTSSMKGSGVSRFILTNRIGSDGTKSGGGTERLGETRHGMGIVFMHRNLGTT
jgi:hypothetical protein